MATDVARGRRLFTVEEYARMVEAGVFGSGERLELIRGEIVEMTPIDDPHAACVANLTRLLVLGVGNRAIVWPQNPIRIGRHSRPQPDVALLTPRSYVTRGTGPAASDVMLVVEVAGTSLHDDRTLKQVLYAEAGIPEYWIVELDAERIEVHRTPGPGGYRDRRRVRRNGVLAPLALADVQIAVADIFA